MLNRDVDINNFLRISVFAIISYIYILTIIYDNDVCLQPFNYILILIFNALCIFRVRKNIYYLIVFFLIFYFDYSIIYPNYIHHIDNFFTTGINSSVTNISINLLCIFSGMLFVLIPNGIKKTVIGEKLVLTDRNLNKKFLFCVFLILIGILLLGVARPTEIGERTTPSPIYEYSVIIYIVSFYFIKDKKIRRVFAFLCFLSACQCFIYGGRVSGVQNLMCLYIFFLSHRISFARMALYSSPLFLIMLIIGAARGAVLQGEFSVDAIMQRFLDGGGALDTCYAAYKTSQIYVFAESRVADSYKYFLFLIVEIFVGSGLFPHMSAYKLISKLHKNYGGGVFPYYFYFYGNLIGVVLSSLIIRFYLILMNSLTAKGKGLLKCLSIFFICTIFRWYLYNPLVLLRGSFLMTIVYLMFYIASSKNTKIGIHHCKYQ